MSTLLTPKDAAAKAHVSESLIYALLKSGKIPALRVGCHGRGKWLIREEDLETFLTNCAVAAQEPESEGELKHIK